MISELGLNTASAEAQKHEKTALPFCLYVCKRQISGHTENFDSNIDTYVDDKIVTLSYPKYSLLKDKVKEDDELKETMISDGRPVYTVVLTKN